MTDTTNDPDEFERRWSDHVEELARLGWSLPDDEKKRLLDAIEELEALVDIAAGEMADDGEPYEMGEYSGIPLGELVNGETSRWQKGICTVVATNNGVEVDGGMAQSPTHIDVYSDDSGARLDHIEIASTPVEDIDRRIADAIEAEQSAL